jgi:hypothetical protein
MSGKSSGLPGSVRLQIGQGIPGAPHGQGRLSLPQNGWSGWASQTHRLLSHRAQNCISKLRGRELFVSSYAAKLLPLSVSSKRVPFSTSRPNFCIFHAKERTHRMRSSGMVDVLPPRDQMPIQQREPQWPEHSWQNVGHR